MGITILIYRLKFEHYLKYDKNNFYVKLIFMLINK